MNNKYYQVIFNHYNYDQFDSFVVCAKSKEEVIEMLKKEYPPKNFFGDIDWNSGYRVEELKGEKGIILGSFNAG